MHPAFPLLLLLVFLSLANAQPGLIFGVGIIEGFDENIRAQIVSINATSGEVNTVGDPFEYYSNYFCTNVVIGDEDGVDIAIASANSFINVNANSGVIISNQTYVGLSGFEVITAVLDPEDTQIVVVLRSYDKYFFGLLDPDSAQFTLTTPIANASPMYGCYGDYDYNSGLFFTTLSTFDVTVYDYDDGGVQTTYYLNGGEEYESIEDIIVDDTTGVVYLLTNNDMKNSRLYACSFDPDSSGLDCEISVTFVSTYVPISVTNSFFDDNTGIIYVVLYQDVSGFDIQLFGAKDGVIVSQQQLDNSFLSICPYGVYSLGM